MKNQMLFLVLFAGLEMLGQGPTPKPKAGQPATSITQSAVAYAQRDIRNKTISIHLQGGIVSTKTNADLAFGKKYGIGITEFGCVGMDREYSLAYNKEIFRYLDREFGAVWRQEIREDMIGFKEYVAETK